MVGEFETNLKIKHVIEVGLRTRVISAVTNLWSLNYIIKLNLIKIYYMKNKTLIYALLVTLLLTSCADVTPIHECIKDDPYGFWGGLWHGMISPISFIFSLFSDNIAMYAVNNNGGWYDFGFVLGAGILLGGGGSSVSKK